uniref:Uncharacterized protein n=1 Tax=Oryza punctata TaxID=4537 RepID=A0A0E0JQR5_ORYPU
MWPLLRTFPPKIIKIRIRSLAIVYISRWCCMHPELRMTCVHIYSCECLTSLLLSVERWMDLSRSVDIYVCVCVCSCLVSPSRAGWPARSTSPVLARILQCSGDEIITDRASIATKLSG